MPAAPRTAGPYSVHPGVAQVQKWIQELPLKTGRSLQEWIALTRKSGPAMEKERREWLKTEHELGTNAASWIAERADGKGTEEDSPDAYLKTAAEWVEGQYSGPRVGLRPLYEQLLKLGFSLGKDVKACLVRRWCRSIAITSLRRSSRRRIRGSILDLLWAT